MADSTLTQADAGRTVAVKSGDRIVVRLEENPSTGYRWNVEQFAPRVLELVSNEYEIAAGSGIGGAGERKLVFRANEPGISLLRLSSVRQWEPNNPSSTFSVNIEVQP